MIKELQTFAWKTSRVLLFPGCDRGTGRFRSFPIPPPSPSTKILGQTTSVTLLDPTGKKGCKTVFVGGFIQEITTIMDRFLLRHLLGKRRN